MLKISFLENTTRFQAVPFQGGKIEAGRQKYACHIQKPPRAKGYKGDTLFFTCFLNQAITGG